MSFRSAQIFVQPRTAKLLRLVTKLYPVRSDTAPKDAMNTGDKNQTADELADYLIRATIYDKYPLADELIREQDKLEKTYIEKAKQ